MNSFTEDDKNHFLAAGLCQGAQYDKIELRKLFETREQGLPDPRVLIHVTLPSPVFGQVELLKDNCINFTFAGSLQLLKYTAQHWYGLAPSIKWDSEISDFRKLIGTYRNREPITESQGSMQLINEMKLMKCSKLMLTVHLPIDTYRLDTESFKYKFNAVPMGMVITLGSYETWSLSELIRVREETIQQNLLIIKYLIEAELKNQKKLMLRDVLKKVAVPDVTEEVKNEEDASPDDSPVSMTTAKKRKGKNQGKKNTFKRKSKRPGRV